jgi:hypothetical protein
MRNYPFCLIIRVKVMKKVLLSLPILLFWFSFIATAQEDVLRPRMDGQMKTKHKEVSFYLGFEAGINFSFLNQTISPNAAPVFDIIKSGSGIAPFFGIIADFPISESFGIQSRLNYDAKHLSKSGSGIDYATDALNYYPKLVNLTVEQDIKYISWSILARINASEDLFFTIGPTIQFRSGEIETTWKPIVQDGTDLQNFPFWGSMGLTGPAGTVTVNELGAINTRVGLEFGVGYKILIGKNIFLIPKAQFQYMFTNSAENTFWLNYIDTSNYITATDKMLHSLQVGVAILFGI